MEIHPTPCSTSLGIAPFAIYSDGVTARAATDGVTIDAEGTVLGRSTWILVDQGMSSLFSLVLGFAAARALSAEHFGLFATLFTSLLLARGVVRAAALDPITIRAAGPRTHLESGYALAATAGVAIAVAVMGLLATPFVSSLTAGAAAAGGAALVGLLLIDTSRLLDIAAGRPRRAAESGLILLVGGTAMLTLSWARPIGLTALLGLTVLMSMITLALRRPMQGPAPSLPGLARWLIAQWRLAAPLLLEFLTNFGALSATVYLLAAIDLTEAGVLRAAQMVAGPLFMLFTGITQVVMTEGARQMVAHAGPSGDEAERAAHRHALARTVRLATIALALSAVVALGYLGAVALTRDALADALKMSDPGHFSALTGIVVLAALTAPSFVVSGLVRALSRPELLLKARVTALFSISAASAYGAFHGGAAGVIHYGVLAELVNLPIWATSAYVAIRSRRRQV